MLRENGIVPGKLPYVQGDYGSGIPRIIDKVKAAGLREPEFICGEVDLRINIYRGQNNDNKIKNGVNADTNSIDGVEIGTNDIKNDVDDEAIPAKLVCVWNKSRKKDWLAIICTDTTISEEIIHIYGKRWDMFFKACKSYLHLVKECRSLSYDALTAHVSIVFARYMTLSVTQRCNTIHSKI